MSQNTSSFKLPENNLPSVGVSWGNKALQNTSVVLFTCKVLLASKLMNHPLPLLISFQFLFNCYLTHLLQYSKNICKILQPLLNLIEVHILNLKIHCPNLTGCRLLSKQIYTRSQSILLPGALIVQILLRSPSAHHYLASHHFVS